MTRNPTVLASFVIAFFLALPVAHGAPKARPVTGQPDACPADVVKQTPLTMLASGADEIARGEVVTFVLLPTGLEEDSESPQATKDEAALAKLAAATALLECLNAKAVREGRQPKLLLNGIALGSGAKLINKTDWSRGEITFELVTALPAEASKKEKEIFADFWKGIYRDAGWTGADPQRVELQMEGVGTIARGDAGAIYISGSPDERRWVAGIAALLIALLFCLAVGSNIFRDEPPVWIEKARTYEGKKKSPDWENFLAEQASLDPHKVISVDELKIQARAAYKRAYEDIPLKNDEEHRLAAIGALLDNDEAPDVSYSLSRVQLGAWLVVTVIGGLIIWVYQGARPVIPATYLALLGISGGTRLLSNVVDGGKQAVGGIHKSFFTDLTAGTNGGGVHRYQAMMINIVLLTTVAFEIIGTLAFPEIDDSWLMLLTGSAGVYLAAKKSGEAPPVKPNPAPPPTTP